MNSILAKLNDDHNEMALRTSENIVRESRIIEIQNEVMTIEVIVPYMDQNKNYNNISQKVAYYWKNYFNELTHTVAAKIFIIDVYKNRFKRSMLNDGLQPEYDAKKGVFFKKGYLN